MVLAMIGADARFGQGQRRSARRQALVSCVKGLALLVAVIVRDRPLRAARGCCPPWRGPPELLVLFGHRLGGAAGRRWARCWGSARRSARSSPASRWPPPPYREAIGARLVSLRDFLLLFFFIDLGARLDLATLGGQLVAAVVLSLFVLIGNPLIVMIVMGVMGYRKRTGFLAGLTVAQISEFSLILAALGLTLGHIDAQTRRPDHAGRPDHDRRCRPT